MSDLVANRTHASPNPSPDPAKSADPRSRARHVARRGAVLTAATALTIATLGLAAPAGAVPTRSASASPAQAPPVGTHGWSTTGSMTTPRVGAAAALLTDGRVLVAGGYDADPSFPGAHLLSSSEVYDPSTGSWTATGSLLRPLADAIAITLGGGDVLLVADGTAQTQLFNPTTGTWKAGADMPSPLVDIVAARLPNGGVMVAGTGSKPSKPLVPSAVGYNPVTNTWANLRRPPQPPWGFVSGSIDGGATLPNGKFFTHFGAFGTTVYNGAANTWRQLGTVRMPVADHSQVALLPNAHVMVAGGSYYNINATIPSERVFDVNTASGTWTQVTDLPRDFSYPFAFLFDGSQLAQLGNGSILATGGNSATDLDYVYRPKAKNWSAVPGRDAHDGSLVTLANGSVLSAGGFIDTAPDEGGGVTSGHVTARTVIYVP